MTSQAHLIVFLSLAVFAAAYQTQTGWLYLTAAGGLAVVLANWLLAGWNARTVRLEALAVPPVHQGEATTLTVLAHRDAPGSALGLQVLLPPRPLGRLFRVWRSALLPEHWQAVTLTEVAPGRPGRASFTLETTRRGEFSMPMAMLQSAYPLGLVAVTRLVPLAGTYLVYPVGPRLTALPWLAPAGASAGQQRLVDDRTGQLIRGVREYRSGDAWREIHWRTTARLGTPHVRETEQDQGEALILMLDLRASIHTEASLEHLVTLAASLVAHAEAEGRPVRLLTQPEATPTGEQMGPAEPGAPAGFEAWAWLARAKATAIEVPHGVPGAVLLSSVYVPGWQTWASHFVYAPAEAANAMDATVYCPVGAAIAETLAQEPRA